MAHIVVVGAGAIGSHVLPHLARLAAVSAISVVDRDRYDRSNLGSQNIRARDIGKSKAQVQAARLREINASIDARALDAPVEELPLGSLRGDVILACLDSRSARMTVNQAAWRLGVPWINAGVDGSGLLVRVQTFVPSAEAACLECAWDARDYELVEQTYPCDGVTGPAASGASSSLAALAAAMQALECEKLLAHDLEHALVGRDVLLDSRHHRHSTTAFRRNPACRMPDHAGWHITPSGLEPCSASLVDLQKAAGTACGSDDRVQIEVAGQRFALALTCEACGEREASGHLHRGERGRHPSPCPTCGGRRVAAGFDLRDEVALDALPEEVRCRSLSELGLVAGDVVRVAASSTEAYLELAGAL